MKTLDRRRPVAALVVSVLVSVAGPALAAPADTQLYLPNNKDSVHFAVIGDMGTAAREQFEVGTQMMSWRARFPYDFVITVGDNIYGGQTAADYKAKFEEPYKALLGAGVKFYASVGNHDNPDQANYKLFNMGGQRFYTFRPSTTQGGVRFFALDSNYMDKPQLDWLEKELAASGSAWKICFFHHPLYSSGARHGSSLDLRKILEPLFVKYGVDVVFAGHDHIYERIKPQQGIYYFVSGSAGSLRKGDARRADFVDVGFDTDFHFMLIEIAGEQMHFQAVTRTGQVIDHGVITRRPRAQEAVDKEAVKPAPSPSPTLPIVASPEPAPSPSPSPKPSATPKPKATPTPKRH